MRFSHKWKWVFTGSLLLGSMGCTDLWHNMQPHRMHRLNRVPDAMNANAYSFSIPDPPIVEDQADENPNATCTPNICPE